MRVIFIILTFLLLSNCFGPTIATMGNYNISLSDVMTSPNKVNKIYDLFKKENTINSDTF